VLQRPIRHATRVVLGLESWATALNLGFKIEIHAQHQRRSSRNESQMGWSFIRPGKGDLVTSLKLAETVHFSKSWDCYDVSNTSMHFQRLG
jgi:hypothetical protein